MNEVNASCVPLHPGIPLLCSGSSPSVYQLTTYTCSISADLRLFFYPEFTQQNYVFLQILNFSLNTKHKNFNSHLPPFLSRSANPLIFLLPLSIFFSPSLPLSSLPPSLFLLLPSLPPSTPLPSLCFNIFLSFFFFAPYSLNSLHLF